jgi:hypothetical protein
MAIRKPQPDDAMPDPPKEICICAAVIADDGTICRGNRHADCMVSLRARGKKMLEHVDGREQGFITSRNRYVDRKEGLEIQIAAGIKSAWRDSYGHELFSEDLY